MSSLQRWVWPPRSSPVPGYDPNPGRVIALPRPINKLHVSQQLCQPGRCRYNQIPGGRDQQSTDWTRRHQRTNHGVRGRRGQQERAGQTATTPNTKSKNEQSNRTGNKKQRQQEKQNKHKKKRSTPKGDHKESTEAKGHPTKRDDQSRQKQMKGQETQSPAHTHTRTKKGSKVPQRKRKNYRAREYLPSLRTDTPALKGSRSGLRECRVQTKIRVHQFSLPECTRACMQVR